MGKYNGENLNNFRGEKSVSIHNKKKKKWSNKNYNFKLYLITIPSDLSYIQWPNLMVQFRLNFVPNLMAKFNS